MMKTWNFGILGPGKIANRFADAFQFVPEARVYAVASRDSRKAREFASKYKAEKQYASYESLVEDPDVDIVYIATPHVFHHEQTLLCLRHGKPVLCEKPLSMNLREATEMVTLARQQNVFLMEGMWSRFFPYMHKAIELIHKGVIGDIQYLTADFGFAAPVHYDGRLYNMALGGGAQLDVGIYPLFLATCLLGKPAKISAHSHLAATGADLTTGAQLYYPNGSIAQLLSSIVADSPKEAIIAGTKGRIHIQSPWYKSQELTLRMNSGESTVFPFPHSGNGFEFQIQEVVRCLAQGKKECEIMSLDFSLMMAEVSDEIRRQGGIRYAADLSEK